MRALVFLSRCAELGLGENTQNDQAACKAKAYDPIEKNERSSTS